MVPVFNDMASKYNNVAFGHVEVTKVDVDNVNGVPVFVGYKNHQPVDVVLGANSRSLTDMIEHKLL
jgi:thiol-disulfide isomerase/thioredoxin